MDDLDDRSGLLRTQAVQHVMSALGAARVNVYGDDSVIGGVYLESESEVCSRTYFRVGEERFEYQVWVEVKVHRRKVD
jgi:hypothetical protein